MKLMPLILSALLVGGCVMVKTPGGGSYIRVGNMAVEQVKVTTPEGLRVEIGKSQSEVNLAETLRNASEAIKNISEVAK